MKLIVGLGNPGQEYRFTRHNFGFMAVDKLSENLSLKFKISNGLKSQVAQKDDLIIAKPLTFMNNSGIAVKNIIQKYNLSIQDLTVLCDDFDILLGKMKLKTKGSSGGHNGLESIICMLETSEFARLRLGIGPVPAEEEQIGFVLGNFTKTEIAVVPEICNKAVAVIDKILESNISAAMQFANTVNTNDKL